MKIAINCSFFIPKGGGIKEYIYNLTTNLAKVDSVNEYVLYVASDYYDYALKELPKTMRIKATPFSSKQAIRRSLLENSFYQKEEKIEKFEVFHSPFFHVPNLKTAKRLITVHDLRLCRYPETYTFLRYQFLKRAVKKSILVADKIITISDFTKNELLHFYDVEESKITSIHEAINLESFNVKNIDNYNFKLNKDLEKDSFVLSVGHLEPRKNYNNLIKAFKKIQNESNLRKLKLVIVGKKSFDYEQTLKNVILDSNILHLDFVDFKDLLWLYSNAKLFVQPSFYEGFGFAPLEAAALGTVSVVSNTSSTPEICKESAFYFDPFEVEDIAANIKTALIDEVLFKEKQDLLASNLSRFSWQKNAEETLKIYNSI
ncbi:glycosyltransferase family 4 protein [Flavobacterium ginsenosidimutans]|uniref:Glycosyltransferase family 1 protein n=1 Tax=Flavobacterium ginsenosidimutans TaxID=687844 RepID=A0ABZ2Q7L4_9FLAO|nr:glycosyltransferase family 1 protein [Flavobacterium ginsenosidimutans]KAF2334165.1 glycosyltransferase family 4 protein [Flavobacterium ginsenosidimutans]